MLFRSDYCLCLAIHAPRKGIIEVHFYSNNIQDEYSTMLYLILKFSFICIVASYGFLLINFLQIWQMRTGPRLRTIACAKGSKMLQPAYRFGASMSSPYVPLEVFLLNGDFGQISVLNRTLD